MAHMKTLYGGILSRDIFKEYCSSQHVLQEAYANCVKYYESKGVR